MAGEIIINEIHYDPDLKTELVEFIELFNPTAGEVDVSNWSFSKGVQFSFAPNTKIPAGSYFIVAENSAEFQAKFGFAPDAVFAGSLSNEGDTLRLRNTLEQTIDEADYKPGFPWPTVGLTVSVPGDGRSIQLINPGFDRGLGGNWRSARPTPGAQNLVLAANAPPQLRQADHSWGSAAVYAQPNEAVTVTIKATDPEGVKTVSLEYQVVEPGVYIAIDDPAYRTGWQTIAMRDDGLGGDAVVGDSVYTAVIPANVQQHRRLVRYRITATDNLNAAVTVPFADDQQPNFAYFVYAGVPAWTGAARPGVTQPVTYSPELLNSLATYHLITTRTDHVDAQHIPNSTQPGYGGDEYLWQGSLVYNGQVYDHIRYRSRGGVWRYSMGKNMWKFDFNHNHEFAPLDDAGRPYPVNWSKLNLSAVIQQGDYLHRGEQGLFESVGFKLFNLAGVPSPETHFVHFRIIENGSEGGASQFNTDFRGLYLAVEQPDGRLLDANGLPDGNFYKMENGTGELNNQGPTQPTDKSDLNAFLGAYNGGSQTDDWWRANLNLENYYSYRSIVEAIHHYDIGYGKNYFYFHDPVTDKWQVMPWDLDLTWANNMFGDGNEPFKSRVLSRPTFALEYRNRLREIRDLLYNPEQTGQLIDEMAAEIYTPGQPSFVDADRAMWDYNPILVSSYVNSSKAGHGRFYQQAATKNFAGMIQLMKNYVASRGAFIDSTLLTDEALVPTKPSVSYTGAAGYPTDSLTFSASPFASGNSTFAAVEWRVAEITDPSNPNYNPADPKLYEIHPAWQSGRLTSPTLSMVIPGDNLTPGQTYRVRLRYQDAAGRWSHWSNASQFIAGQPVVPVQDKLRVTEVHYHAAAPSAAEIAAGYTDADRFDYLEVTNITSQPLNLDGFRVTAGFDFTFPAVSLGAGQSALIVNDRGAFEFRYGFGHTIVGEMLDGKLSNGGERLKLETGGGQTIVDFAYDDAWFPATDGGGRSLVIVDPAASLNVNPLNGQSLAWSMQSSWRASTNAGGSPGRTDPPSGAAPPAAPTGLGGSSPSWSQISLSWTDASNDETGFQIERSTDGIHYALAGTAPAGASSYLDDGLGANTTYHYRVRSTNLEGNSPATAAVVVATQLPPLPSPPSGLSAVANSAGQIDLAWIDNSGDESSFRVERRLGPAGPWMQIATLPANATSFRDSGLTPSTTYFYRLRASNAAGVSLPSGEASATTSNAIPNQVGYWRFDEATGDSTSDGSASANNGTLINGPSRLLGTNGARAGNALTFDGVNDFVATEKNLGTWLNGAATLATWIRTTQVGNNTFWQAPGITGVEQAGGGDDIFWGWLDASGRIGILAGNTAGAKSAQPINDGQWRHIALTRDPASGRVEVYVDGVLNAAANSEVGLKTTPFFSIGRIEDTGGSPANFAGSLDELQIFDRVLSASEIQALRQVSVVRQGTSGNDSFTIDRNSDETYLRIVHSAPGGAQPIYVALRSLVRDVEIHGLAGNDSVVIDYGRGSPVPAGGLAFNGGDGDDSLTLDVAGRPADSIATAFRAGGGVNMLTISNGPAAVESTVSGDGVLNTVVNAGATLRVSRLVQNGLTLAGPESLVSVAPHGANPGVVMLSSLQIAPGGKLDLADNDLILNYTGDSPLAAVYQALVDGALNTPGASQIVSSTAGSDRFHAPFDNAGVGLTEWLGQPLSGVQQIIAKYAYFGDLNLDGMVDAADYLAIDNNFGGAASWLGGDANLDGLVNAQDYVAVDNAFGRGAGGAVAAAPPLPVGAPLAAATEAAPLEAPAPWTGAVSTPTRPVTWGGGSSSDLGGIAGIEADRAIWDDALLGYLLRAESVDSLPRRRAHRAG